MKVIITNGGELPILAKLITNAPVADASTDENKQSAQVDDRIIAPGESATVSADSIEVSEVTPVATVVTPSEGGTG